MQVYCTALYKFVIRNLLQWAMERTTCRLCDEPSPVKSPAGYRLYLVLNLKIIIFRFTFFHNSSSFQELTKRSLGLLTKKFLLRSPWWVRLSEGSRPPLRLWIPRLWIPWLWTPRQCRECLECWALSPRSLRDPQSTWTSPCSSR